MGATVRQQSGGLPQGFVLDAPSASALPPGFKLDSQPEFELPEGFVLDSPSPNASKQFPITADTQQEDFIGQRKVIGGKSYGVHRETGAVYDTGTNRVVVDPAILGAFGKTRPTKRAQQQYDLQTGTGVTTIKGIGDGMIPSREAEMDALDAAKPVEDVYSNRRVIDGVAYNFDPWGDLYREQDSEKWKPSDEERKRIEGLMPLFKPEVAPEDRPLIDRMAPGLGVLTSHERRAEGAQNREDARQAVETNKLLQAQNLADKQAIAKALGEHIPTGKETFVGTKIPVTSAGDRNTAALVEKAKKPPPTIAKWRDFTERGIESFTNGLISIPRGGAEAVDAARYFETPANLGRATKEALMGQPDSLTAEREKNFNRDKQEDRAPFDRNQVSLALEETAKSVRRQFLGDKARADELISQLGQGGGSMASFLIGGAAAKLLKVPSKVGTMLTGASVGGVQGAEDAQQNNATDTARYLSFLANAAIGTTEAIPIDRALNRLNVASGGKVAQIIASGTASSLEELIQEVGQQIGGNAVAKVLYDNKRDIFAGVDDAAKVAGILGFLMGGGITAIKTMAPGEEVPPPKDTPPPAASAPRAEPNMFAAEPATAHPDISTDVLLQSGYTAEDIADMNPTEKASAVQAAADQGVKPRPVVPQDLPQPNVSPEAIPEVGTAPMAPRNFAPPKAAVPEGFVLDEPASQRAQTVEQPDVSTVASVPFMITKAMKADLGARGYSNEQIASLKPEQAQEILKTPQPVEARSATVSEKPAELSTEPSKPLPAETLGTEYREFSPSELKVDAKRFQFKEDANDEGITDRLKGVKTWDKTKAGITLVWQNKQGENFVADGHQRYGLASKLEAEGQKPKMLAVTLREQDGITPEKARAIAAAKNIAEGTGTAIDAAKILRDTPHVALSLPPNSALVRDAQGLAKLSDDGFGMVVNKKVQPAHAAIVGQLAPEPKTHAELLGLLVKNEPGNVTEAESMVRDALEAPAVQSTMEDMFGSAETTQILFKERALILSAAATAIRKDRAAFSTLVKEEGRIASAGNKLVTDKNAERATQDAELLATLQATARRKGPIADALATAAKQLHDGQSAKTVIGNFLDVLRGGNKETGESRSSAGGTGRQDEAAVKPDADENAHNVRPTTAALRKPVADNADLDRSPEGRADVAGPRGQQEVSDPVRETGNRAPEGGKPAQVNLSKKSDEPFPKFYAGISNKQRAEITARLNAISERVLGRRIKFKLVDKITDSSGAPTSLQGVYDPNTRTVEVAIQAAYDFVETFGHEALHALRDLGVFTADEWALLKADTRKTKIDGRPIMDDVREKYEDMYRASLDLTEAQLQDVLVEEAVAHMIGEYVAGNAQPRVGVARIIDKLMRFLEALRNMVEGYGFRTGQDVAIDIASGNMRDRVGSEGPGRGYYLLSKQAQLAPSEIFPEEEGADGLPQLVIPSAERVSQGTHAQLKADAPLKPRVAQKGLEIGLFGDDSKQGRLFQRAGPRQGQPAASTSFDPLHDQPMEAWADDTLRYWGAGQKVDQMIRAAALEKYTTLKDRHVAISRLVEAIERRIGKALPDHMNPFLASRLFAGRMPEAVRVFEETRVKPLVEAMANRKITPAELGPWLQARHVEERNNHLGQYFDPGDPFYEAMTDPAIIGASGWSQNEADAVLEKVKRSGRSADFKHVADMVYQINDEALSVRLTAGLMDQESYDRIAATYEFYVPHQGFEAEPDNADFIPGIGLGFDLRAPEFRRALGRRSKADNPLAYVVSSAKKGIIRAEKARVDRSMLLVAQTYPNSELYQIDKVETKRIAVVDAEGNTTIQEVRDRGADQADNVLVVKIGGKARRITFTEGKGDRLARAMKNLEVPQLGPFVRFFHTLNRMWAQLNTSRSPEFLTKNFHIDSITALININAEGKAKAALNMVRTVGRAMRGMNRHLNGKHDTVWANHAADYAAHGGKMEYLGLIGIENEKKMFERLYKQQTERVPMTKKALWDATLGRLERWNDALENAWRLSAYVALVKHGISKDRSAQAARDLTVDFSVHGEYGPNINAFYAFFNATAEGQINIIKRYVYNKHTRRIFNGLILLGFTQTLLNYWIAVDDDDGEDKYAKIDDFTKLNNFIFMVPSWAPDKIKPKAGYYTYPARGWNIFHIVGQMAAETVVGDRTPTEAVSIIATSLIDFANPMGNAGGGSLTHNIINTISSTMLDPIVDVGFNENYMGSEIVPDSGKYDKRPQSERHRKTTSEAFVYPAKKLNEVTGGSDERSGTIDVSPEVLEHWYEFVTGGVGRLLSRSWNTIENIATGTELDPEKLPFARLYLGQDQSFEDRNLYYKIKDAVETTERELKAREEDGDDAAIERIVKKYWRETQIIEDVNDVEKELTGLRKEKREMQKNLEVDEATRRAVIKDIDAQMDTQMLDIRRLWNTLRKQKVTE